MNKIEELEEFVKSLSSSVDELTTEMFMLKKEIAELKKR
jgi:peptidoglycan hydrolase CwlO-like protein